MSEADAAATPGIERDAVTDWLREHIDGAAPPFTFSLVAAGGSNLTYRVVDICTGDLGFSSKRTFDIEVYAPGCDMWLEVSSVSWFGDFQGRRGNARYRPTGGKGTEILHTLNGSAMAWSRIWPAIVETHRLPDGTVGVPEVLRPYLGGTDVAVEGEWVWSDGTEWDFEFWGEDEPNNYSEVEHCLTSDSTGYWNDTACDGEMPYVCEVPPPG